MVKCVQSPCSTRRVGVRWGYAYVGHWSYKVYIHIDITDTVTFNPYSRQSLSLYIYVEDQAQRI